jgi:NADH-quinone oxidoreductase subunit J
LSPTVANSLYAGCVLGALALYTLLPQRRPRALVGIVLGMMALCAWLLILGLRIAVPGTSVFFYLFAALALASAVRVITHTKPVYSALYFVLVIVSVAALLVLMRAEFLAAAIIIIYAGAILVTYLFVIMLAQQSGAPAYDRISREPFWSVVAGFLFLAAVTGQAGELSSTGPRRTVPVAMQESTQRPNTGNTAAVGASLMTTYVVGVELAGLLLLVSMIGAIGLARKRLPPEVPASLVEVGRAGKDVRPF